MRILTLLPDSGPCPPGSNEVASGFRVRRSDLATWDATRATLGADVRQFALAPDKAAAHLKVTIVYPSEATLGADLGLREYSVVVTDANGTVIVGALERVGMAQAGSRCLGNTRRVDRYTTKRRLLRPVTAWRRRQALDESPFNRAVFEAHDYRPAMRQFFDQARQQPDILIDVDLPEAAVVLDVGAYEGEWSKRVLGRADACGPQDLRIHAFEPEPRAVRRLRATMGHDERFQLHPFGLGGADRLEVMTIAGPGSSVYLDPTTASAFGSTEVALRDVDAVLSSLAVDRIDLVKINIEGGEFELIDRLHDTGWLERTGSLIVQFHEFAPDAYRARRRNRRQMAETHRCVWGYTWVYERWDPR